MQTKVFTRKLVGWTGFVGLVVGDGWALVGLRPIAARSWRHLPHLGQWLGISGCDKALAQLAATALWLAALWLAVGLVTALAATLPGRPGRLAAAACRTVLPQAARRLLAGAAGLGVLLTPAAALAASSPAASSPAASSPAASLARIAGSAPHSPGKWLPAPTWPTGRPPTRPISPPGPSTTPAPARPAPPRDAGAHSTVQVRRGDCLWLLAARRLPPGAPDGQIAAYWPRWYAANREVVGTDPGLLQPGEVLTVPAPPAPSSH